jgi:hypothetical protein
MAVSSCPSCREQVTVPAGAPGNARVRCPLCNDEFLLSVVLEKLPPALILLDVPDAASPVEGISIGPVVGTRAPAFDFDEAAAPSVERKVSPAARPKRKEKSIVLELVKIVLGGVVGIALATIILWWGFHKDPLNLAPKVAAYAAWAVPAKLRPTEETPPEEKNGKKGNAGASSSNGKNNAGRNVAAKDTSGGQFGEPAKPIKPEILGEPVFSGNNTKKPDDDPLNLNKLPVPNTTPKEVKPKEPKPNETTPATPAGEGTRAKRFDLAKTLKKRNALDLSLAIDEVQKATDDIDPIFAGAAEGLSAEKRLEFGETYHKALARLGEIIISVDPNDSQIQNASAKLAPLMQDIATNPRKQQLLARLAERWQTTAKRPNSGLCVVGTVKRISPSGRLHEIDVELLTKDKTVVTVLAGDDPTAFYQPEARVLLLGAIISDPKKNLTGYQGDAKEVGCVHFYVPLAAEKPAETEPPSSEKPAEKPGGSKPETGDKPKPADQPKPEPEEAK